MSYNYLWVNKAYSPNYREIITNEVTKEIKEACKLGANKLVYQCLADAAKVEFLQDNNLLKMKKLELIACKEICKNLMFFMANRNASMCPGDDSSQNGKLAQKHVPSGVFAAFMFYAPIFAEGLENLMIGCTNTVKIFRSENELINSGTYSPLDYKLIL